jgi:DNA-binding transcriptional MerR regulator
MSDEHRTRLFQIGELAALTGATPRALRLYESRGLLSPVERSESGYRLYGTRELVRALRIRRLRDLGLSLEQVAGVVADDADPGLLPEQLAVLRDELRTRAAALAKAADEATLFVGGDDAAWRELLAAAEHGAELEAVRQQAQGAEGPAALAGLLSDPGWTRRWEPLSERLRALRAVAADDPEVEALAHEVAELLPRAVLPDEASPPDRLELFLGRRFSAAQVRCLHVARALLDDPERAGKMRS